MQSEFFNEMINSKRINEALESYGELKSFSKNQILLDENSYIRAIPVVKKGIIKVYRTDDDDKEILLYYIKEGETCVMSFLGGLHNDKSKVKAVVEEDSEIWLLPIEKVGMLNREYPEWIEYIFKLYHKRFEDLLDVVNAVAFKKVDERLIDFLMKKSDNLNTKNLQVTHEQISQELGTSRVVISRLLKHLEYE